MKSIYLDYAATTPVDPMVKRAMEPYFSDIFGNASSVHSFGREARTAIDQSRETISKFLNCQTTEIIFTSGGSESNNLAIRGLISSVIPTFSAVIPAKAGIQDDKGIPPLDDSVGMTKENIIQRLTDNRKLITIFKPHIITSAFEHHAVLNTVLELEKSGLIEATYIKPNRQGLIDPKDIEKAIKDNTVLVSVIYVNNEIGTVQPIREIGKMIERVNNSRQSSVISGQEKPDNRKPITDNYPRVFFHTDAVQAAEFANMDVDYLHVDLLTMTAHKIYGPKGVGLLYIKKGTPIKHQIIGGEQEYRRRAGTENVTGVVGFARAIELLCHCEESATRQSQDFNTEIATPKRLAMTNTEIATPKRLAMTRLRDKLIDGILKSIPDSFLNGSREDRSPANVNVSFMNAEGESILLNLDMEGVAASTGSACTSGALEPSHVLLSMGLKPEECHGSIRFSLGRSTTEADIDHVLDILPGIVEKLRKMSPFDTKG